MWYDDDDGETPETEPEPTETTHSDDWGDTDGEDPTSVPDDDDGLE